MIETCSTGTCSRPVKAQGLCGSCYWLAYGQPKQKAADRDAREHQRLEAVNRDLVAWASRTVTHGRRDNRRAWR